MAGFAGLPANMSETRKLRGLKPGRRSRGSWARLRCLWALLACLLLAPGGALAAPFLGADLDLPALSPDERAAELSRLASAGVQGVRWRLDWNRVEPRPGEFVWRADDAGVEAARTHGLEVTLVLGPCAEWAVDPGRNVPPGQLARSVPRDLDSWRRYVRQAVSHFAGRVGHWQVRRQPNLHNFRGARGEYFALLAAAREEAKRVDPDCLIIKPEPGSLGIAHIAEVKASETWQQFDRLGVYLDPRPDGLSSLALAWSVLCEEVLPDGESDPRGRPVWVLGSGDILSADEWVQRYLLAWAFGAERCYLPSDAISAEWTAPLQGFELAGWLRLGPHLWAMALHAGEQWSALAWSDEEQRLPACALAPLADEEAARQARPLGGAPGTAAAEDLEHVTLRVGPRPVLIPGLDPEPVRPFPITREAVLAARGGVDLSAVPLVYVDWAMQERPELGLAQTPLRGLIGGRVSAVEWRGRQCVRTHMRPGRGRDDMDNPWIYFDVDDGWMYFDQGRTPVAITVECEGAFVGRRKLGFNIMYDSVTGYRFTRWQWVDAGPGWRRYRFELKDATFSNRNGYDFRINAKGSKQDLWVASVTVEKLPPPANNASP